MGEVAPQGDGEGNPQIYAKTTPQSPNGASSPYTVEPLRCTSRDCANTPLALYSCGVSRYGFIYKNASGVLFKKSKIAHGGLNA